MRTSKTVNGTVTEYIYDGSTLLAQKVGNDWMYFFYDADGILGFIYDNCAYYYAKNLQGDVLSVLDSYGTTVCEYTYDSWGKLITVTDDSGNAVTDSTHIALLNPIRYRGYLYDSDTGFYYLQSRYYNPEVKRFVNGDAYVATGQGMLGNNMFAYCGNNPIIRADTSGQLWGLIGLGAFVIGKAFVLSGCSSRASSSVSSSSSSSSSPSTSSNSAQSSSEIPPSASQSSLTSKQKKDRLAIAQTIIGEAGGIDAYPNEWKQGQEAVAWIIINRYNSSKYPDDWTAIVTAEQQFNGYSLGVSWYEDGKCNTVAWDYAYELAGYMVTGDYWNIPFPEGFNSNFMNFYRAKGNYTGENGVIYGGNYFYQK